MIAISIPADLDASTSNLCDKLYYHYDPLLDFDAARIHVIVDEPQLSMNAQKDSTAEDMSDHSANLHDAKLRLELDGSLGNGRTPCF